MSDVYFACAWIIRPQTDYRLLTERAYAAGCDLVAIAPITISKDGYAVMTFAVRTESEAHLVAFVKSVGAETGLTHWYGVPEDYYAKGNPFDLEDAPEEIAAQWLAGMEAYGQHNETLRQKKG